MRGLAGYPKFLWNASWLVWDVAWRSRVACWNNARERASKPVSSPWLVWCRSKHLDSQTLQIRTIVDTIPLHSYIYICIRYLSFIACSQSSTHRLTKSETLAHLEGKARFAPSAQNLQVFDYIYKQSSTLRSPFFIGLLQWGRYGQLEERISRCHQSAFYFSPWSAQWKHQTGHRCSGAHSPRTTGQSEKNGQKEWMKLPQ